MPAFSKFFLPPLDGPTPTPPANTGHVVLGNSCIPLKFFPLYFPLCWSVGEWVGASWVSPTPLGVGQVLCMPAKSGCLPSHSPPPPVAEKSPGQNSGLQGFILCTPAVTRHFEKHRNLSGGQGFGSGRNGSGLGLGGGKSAAQGPEKETFFHPHITYLKLINVLH